MSLLSVGAHVLHSGALSPFKIDCDYLSDEDLYAAAWLLRELLPAFSTVEGVPTGGLRLAALMSRWAASEGHLLIVDDVLTTGTSMEEHRDGREAVGAVLFSRGPCPAWVTPLFTAHPALT